MKIVDAFCFFNELDMLDLRIKMLSPYVDSFVIVEADHTFSGKAKSSCFEANKERFRPYLDRIVHHIARIDVSQMDFTVRPEKFDVATDFWRVEFAQRNAISDALRGFDPSDLVVFGDVDEIPSPAALMRLKKSAFFRFLVGCLPHSFKQEEFYYNARNLRLEPWFGSIVTSCDKLVRLTPQKLRDRRKKLPKIRGGGYHFSYFMSPEQIANKIDSFSHQEFNTDFYKSNDRIASCLNEGVDLFGRNIPVRTVSLDHFPLNVRSALQEFPVFCGNYVDRC